MLHFSSWPGCATVVLSVLTFGAKATRADSLATDLAATNGRVIYNRALTSAVIAPTELNNTGWTVTADSYQPGNAPSNVLDNKPTTIWHTEWSPVNASLPHSITIDMKNSYSVNGLNYLPRQDGQKNGNIGEHTISLSLDGVNWGTPVASGTWADDSTLKQTFFTSTAARYVRLSAQSEAQGKGYQWSSCTEIKVLTAPDPTLPRDKWTVTADSAEPPPQFNSAAEAVDGSTTTFWHTQYDGSSVPGFPHTFTIDQSTAVTVSGLTYLPRPASTGPNGRIGNYSIQYSSDDKTWTTVATGSWPDTADPKLVEFTAVSARYFRLTSLSEAGNRGPWTSAAEINLLDGSSQLPDFQVAVDSQETASADNAGINALDGDLSTFWHTDYSVSPVPGFPHNFTIDMQSTFSVHSLTYTPRQDGIPNGNIGNHMIQVSSDAVTWTNVATGAFFDDSEVKLVNFQEVSARYVRLIALSEAGNRGPWSSAAEISVGLASNYSPPPTTMGQWGATIDFPIVPVAVVLLNNGQVLTWSSYEANQFEGTDGDTTLTATYNPATGQVSQATVTNVQHDMFCPGLSTDFTGRPVVTGGNNAPKASIYSPVTNAWIAAPNMQIPRGYQASCTLSDGRTFTIGGSWSGGEGNKNGEIYSPIANTWTLLPGCPVAPMLTNDAQGVYRADNHGWLFGWKDGSVFQAGPSKAMNWYGTSGNGSQTAAGLRASDTDSMNGNAVMYDAVNGKILTVGGATSYQDASATGNAHIITIGTPGSTPTVTTIGSMSYARAFANGVVLPNGEVFIVGGQSYAIPFTDDQAVLYPELFNPATNTFAVMAPMANVRTYHSVALLMPDATVFSGGGGLCGDCNVNHFDAQIFNPPYLFTATGALATRPVITSTSPTTVALGGTITVTTNSAVTSFSLIRYGSATHTVDTDQRRIALTPTASGLTYKMTVPSDAGIALGGYWMLFAISSAGVPSVASTVLIQ